MRSPAPGLAPSQEEAVASTIDEKYVATSCLNCQGRCAIVVRVVNGKAVKIAGNPFSLASEGKTCPRSHVGLQVLYDPGRIKTPLKRTNPEKGKGVDPRWQPISWDEASGLVSARLHDLRARAPEALLLLYGLNSRATEDILLGFAQAFGTPNVMSTDALENRAESVGRWLADGHGGDIAYDLARSNYVLAFGANLLESQTPLSGILRQWGKMRREKGTRGKVVVVDPRHSVTAAKADEWLPVNPGTDAALALAIAHVLIKQELFDTDFVGKVTAGFEAFKALVLRDYEPAKVASITGVDAGTIQRIAREFAQSRPAIAWSGRGVSGWPNGSYAAYAIYCLNALTGSLDVPGGVIYPEPPRYSEMPVLTEDEISRKGRAAGRIDSGPTVKTSETLGNEAAQTILSGKPYPIDVAMGFNANLTMSTPYGSGWDEALKKIAFYVHVSPFPSEMAQYADILLPGATYLEEWGYEHSPFARTEVRLKQPAVQAQFQARSSIDIVLDLAAKAGGSVTQSFKALGGSASDFVKLRTSGLADWSSFQQTGVCVGPDYRYGKQSRIFETPSKKFEFRSGTYEAWAKSKGVQVKGETDFLPHYEPATFLGSEAEYPLVLTTYHPVMSFLSGSQNYPWAQEIFLAMHGRGWDNFVEVNAETAKKYGISDGDMVYLESPAGKLKAKARVFQGLPPGVVAVALGQGHYAYGQWQKGIGVNPNDIIGGDRDRLSGAPAVFNTRVRIARA